jgi:Flp pilus assembly pilin Flp
MKRLRRLTGARHDSGATAVEFALVAPVLLLLVFGIITYGLWFSDSLSAKQGVREAARQGVVANFGTGGCSLTSASGDANSLALMCTAQERIGGITGDPSIMVSAPEGWVRGKPLVVCSQLKAGVGSGIIPLPEDRIIRSEVEMAIEQAAPGVEFSGGSEAPPAGGDWSWCG